MYNVQVIKEVESDNFLVPPHLVNDKPKLYPNVFNNSMHYFCVDPHGWTSQPIVPMSINGNYLLTSRGSGVRI